MTRFDHLRRAVSVVLVAVSLIVVPAVASATFSSRQAPALVVGTDRMETPTGVTGTWRCIPNGLRSEAFTFTTTGFTDSGPAGATYEYSISRAGSVVESESSTSKAVTVTTPNLQVDLGSTAWTINIRSKLKSWTGAAYTKTVTCPALGNASGNL